MTFRIYGTAIMTILAATSLSALAQPVELPQEEVEQVPNKKLEERGERIKGPITSISPAALLFASFDKIVITRSTIVNMRQASRPLLKKRIKTRAGH